MYAQAIALTVSAAIGAAGAWQWQANNYSRQISDLKTEYATAQVRALERAHADTIRFQTQAAEAARKQAARQAALANAVAAVRTERDGLRDDLAEARAALPGASCTSLRDHAATLNTVFGLCAARLEGLAGQAQGHAIDALNLLEACSIGRSSTIESER